MKLTKVSGIGPKWEKINWHNFPNIKVKDNVDALSKNFYSLCKKEKSKEINNIKLNNNLSSFPSVSINN